MREQVAEVKKERGRLIERPLRWWDLLLLVLIFLLCFLTLLHEDILVTAQNALTYLNGHIADFYDTAGIKATYMPSIFILFALWCAPLRLMGIIGNIQDISNFSLVARLWLQLLPILVSFASAWVMYLICEHLGLGKKKSRLCVFFYLTSPIFFFSVYIFSQHDIFTVFFVLLGILFWLKERRLLFALMFGISITFKYFSLPVFIVALVLSEKDLWKIVKSCLIFVCPFLFEVLLFSSSEGFFSYVFGFWGAQFPFTAGINNGAVNISIFVVGMCVIFSAAFFQDAKDLKERFAYLIYYSSFVCFLYFGIAFWFPQYLLFAVPFWALGTFLNKRSDFFMLLDLVLMAFFTIYTVTTWQNNVDQEMFKHGIFMKQLLTHPFDKMIMADLLEVTDQKMCYSIMSAIMLVNAIFKHPKFWVSDFAQSVDKQMGLIRMRFLGGTACFLVPAFIVLYTALYGPMLWPVGEVTADIGPITDERIVSEIFTASRGSLKEMEVLFEAGEALADSQTQIEIVDLETYTQIWQTWITNSELKDGKRYSIKTGKLELVPERQYAINFLAKDAEDGDSISIAKTADKESYNDGHHYVNVDDKYQLYDLAVWLYGD